MNNSGMINTYEDEGLFLYSPTTGTEESIEVLAPSPWPDLESLYRGDSMNYISQFLSLIEEELPNEPKQVHKDTSAPQNDESKSIFLKNESGEGTQKVKKIRKVTNSPFHNYQKHLNNALKKMITLPDYKHLDQLHQKVAHRLWSKYIQSEIKTKKILHSVFNQRYEYQTNETELRSFGFWDIYLEYGDSVFREAKGYLSRLAVEQINAQNIDEYLKTRKLIKRDGFKEYLLEFRQQLINGFLKRRIILGHAES